jgi:hypothetical protein
MLGSVEKALLSVDDDIEQHRDAETIKSALRVLRANAKFSTERMLWTIKGSKIAR